MKKNIHPQYFAKAQVKCACGHVFYTGAAVPEINTEICSQCHPFYTGKEKVMDRAGRVEKFKQRLAKGQALKTKQGQKTKKQKTAAKRKTIHLGNK